MKDSYQVRLGGCRMASSRFPSIRGLSGAFYNCLSSFGITAQVHVLVLAEELREIMADPNHVAELHNLPYRRVLAFSRAVWRRGERAGSNHKQ